MLNSNTFADVIELPSKSLIKYMKDSVFNDKMKVDIESVRRLCQKISQK